MATNWLRMIWRPTIGNRSGFAFLLLVAVSGPALSFDRIAGAGDFIASIAVNTHVMYMDGGYKNVDQTIGALTYLGIHNIRDGPPHSDALSEMRLGQVAAAGGKFDFIVSADIPETLTRIEKFNQKYPGSVTAIEGPNEVNNWPVSYNGVGGQMGAMAFQEALYDGVKNSSVLHGVPVYNFTDYPQPAGKADYYNTHPYPQLGAQPYRSLAPDLSLTAAPMPNVPRVITEAGYCALPDPRDWKGPRRWSPVDPRSQAILITNLLLDSFALGAGRTYLYQLLDAYPDPDTKDADKHFGLFNLFHNPKPAAIAIHNLTALLNDPDGSVPVARSRPSAITLEGLPHNAHTLLLEKHDGTAVIAIWNEDEVWNPDLQQPITSFQHAIEVRLMGIRRSIAVYNPLESQLPVSAVKHADHAPANLSDELVLIILSPE